MDILTLFGCCSTLTTSTTVRQLAIIAQAMLSMTGRAGDAQSITVDR